MKKKSLVICAITASTFLLTACATVPPNAFMVTPEILQQRQLESRRYDSIKEADLLTASANVLQDLGYNLENSESRLGILTASKQRNAVNPGEVAAALVVALLGGGIMPISQDQIIRVALVCIDPVNSCSGVNVEGNDDEHPDGRRHQALDSQA